MRKTVKIILIAVLGSLFCLSAFVGCASTENSGKPEDTQSPFLEEYRADYGEVYYFETVVLNGKPLEYTVSYNGATVDVRNYGFTAAATGVYDVEVKYAEAQDVFDTFRVVVDDNDAPNVALSYYQKFVSAGSTVKLPKISVSDNADRNLSYDAVLTKNGSSVAISDGAFIAEEGEYLYTVSVTDSVGNQTEKTCLIAVGGELDLARAVNWMSSDTDVEYCREISGGTMEISDEIVYGGFDSSLKITLNEANDVTCLTVKNALIEDISEYDYLLIYVYNDMTSTRQYSVSWSPNHVGTLNVGEWVPIAFPINEHLVSDSNNVYFKEMQDWKDCNGMRFYIQGSDKATGSIYLTDLFLLKVPNETDFLGDLSTLEGYSATDAWQSQYNLVDVKYNVLKAAGASFDLNGIKGRTSAKYSQLILGDKYDENKLTYADENFSISQLISYGDWWSVPQKVAKTSAVKYGEEGGSYEVTFDLAKNRANTRVINPSVLKKAPAGEVVFRVKNATQSELHLYNNETADTGLYPIKVSDEWQEVRLAVNSSSVLETLDLILYTADFEVVKPMSDNTAKVYYSDISFVPAETKGSFLQMNESSVETFTGKWAGNETISFATDSDKLYNGQGVLSVNQVEALGGGRFGFLLNKYKLAALLAQGSVKLTVTYNVKNVSEVGTYIGFYGMEKSLADRSDGWHTMTTTFTAMPQHFIFGIGSLTDFGWEGKDIQGEMLIADISYEIVEAPRFTVAASSKTWQDPEFVTASKEYVYGDLSESAKVGFKIGYNYANVILTLTEDQGAKYVEFHILNMTGKILEVYTEYGIENGDGVKEVAANDGWQKIRLMIDPASSSHEILIRGKNESVVSDTESLSYYIVFTDVAS